MNLRSQVTKLDLQKLILQQDILNLQYWDITVFSDIFQRANNLDKSHAARGRWASLNIKAESLKKKKKEDRGKHEIRCCTLSSSLIPVSPISERHCCLKSHAGRFWLFSVLFLGIFVLMVFIDTLPCSGLHLDFFKHYEHTLVLEQSINLIRETNEEQITKQNRDLFSGQKMLISLVVCREREGEDTATTTISALKPRVSTLICSAHMPAAAFPIIPKTKRRMLTSSDNWDTLIYIWLPGVCAVVVVVVVLKDVGGWGLGGTSQDPRPDKSKLFTRCCWFSLAAGWVAAEGKQTKCHSSPSHLGVGGGWMDGFKYCHTGGVCVCV